MRIYLLFTENFDAITRKNTMAFLKRNAGQIEYIDKDAPAHLAVAENFTEIEAFQNCNNFRGGFRREDFVALITDKEHEDNWFSHYDSNRNIYVTTHGISDIFDDLSDDIYIATELIGNVIHSSSQLNISTDMVRGYIHTDPEGCVNDFCDDRKQIKIKMRSGMMCKKCFNRALEHMNSQELSDLLSKLSQVRKRMIDFNVIDEKKSPDLYISGSRIFIGEKNGIEMLTGPRLRAFYIFLLGGYNGNALRTENNEVLDPKNGLTLEDIYRNRNLFLSVYEKTRDEARAVQTIASFFGQPKSMEINSLEDLSEQTYQTFLSGNHGLLNDTKGRINKEIKQKLKKISPDYEIKLNKGRYRIHLNREKIHFE